MSARYVVLKCVDNVLRFVTPLCDISRLGGCVGACMLDDDKFAEYLCEFTTPNATAELIVKPWRGNVICDLKPSTSRSSALDPLSYVKEIFAMNSRIFHYPDELTGGKDTHDPIPKSSLGMSQQEKEVRNDKARIILAMIPEISDKAELPWYQDRVRNVLSSTLYLPLPVNGSGEADVEESENLQDDYFALNSRW